jgi:3-methyladenine DNA glycosylase AlkC
MLIALFAILFLGGSDTAMLDYIADTQETVKVVMDKDDRRKEALATLKAMEKRSNAQNKMVKRTSKDLSKSRLGRTKVMQSLR